MSDLLNTLKTQATGAGTDALRDLAGDATGGALDTLQDPLQDALQGLDPDGVKAQVAAQLMAWVRSESIPGDIQAWLGTAIGADTLAAIHEHLDISSLIADVQGAVAGGIGTLIDGIHVDSSGVRIDSGALDAFQAKVLEGIQQAAKDALSGEVLQGLAFVVAHPEKVLVGLLAGGVGALIAKWHFGDLGSAISAGKDAAKRIEAFLDDAKARVEDALTVHIEGAAGELSTNFEIKDAKNIGGDAKYRFNNDRVQAGANADGGLVDGKLQGGADAFARYASASGNTNANADAAFRDGALTASGDAATRFDRGALTGGASAEASYADGEATGSAQGDLAYNKGNTSATADVLVNESGLTANAEGETSFERGNLQGSADGSASVKDGRFEADANGELKYASENVQGQASGNVRVDGGDVIVEGAGSLDAVLSDKARLQASVEGGGTNGDLRIDNAMVSLSGEGSDFKYSGRADYDGNKFTLQGAGELYLKHLSLQGSASADSEGNAMAQGMAAYENKGNKFEMEGDVQRQNGQTSGNLAGRYSLTRSDWQLQGEGQSSFGPDGTTFQGSTSGQFERGDLAFGGRGTLNAGPAGTQGNVEGFARYGFDAMGGRGNVEASYGSDNVFRSRATFTKQGAIDFNVGVDTDFKSNTSVNAGIRIRF